MLPAPSGRRCIRDRRHQTLPGRPLPSDHPSSRSDVATSRSPAWGLQPLLPLGSPFRNQTRVQEGYCASLQLSQLGGGAAGCQHLARRNVVGKQRQRTKQN
jgi:hypothetical protein